MEVLWACGTRTGSEFAVKLTRNVCNDSLEPYSAITPGRLDTIPGRESASLSVLASQEELRRYFKRYSIRSIKLEEPGKDEFLERILSLFPKIRVISTYRKIEDVIVSHYNLKWGYSVEYILHNWRNAISKYEAIESEGSLFMLDLNMRDDFSYSAFRRFLGAAYSDEAKRFVDEWAAHNDLEYRQLKSGTPVQKVIPACLGNLRIEYPWIVGVEQRYARLCRKSSGY